MADFKFGDFVIVDGRWHGVVIRSRFDAVDVATPDGIAAWWNRDRLEYDNAANAERHAAALARVINSLEADAKQAFRGSKNDKCGAIFNGSAFGPLVLSQLRMVKGVNDSEA